MSAAPGRPGESGTPSAVILEATVVTIRDPLGGRA